MTLDQAKEAVEAAEPRLEGTAFVEAHRFERDGRSLRLCLTERLRKACRHARLWKSKAFLGALKNAAYGFDAARARSPGGRDGIFLVTRDHEPRNAMMAKLFDGFLDRGEADGIAAVLGCTTRELLPVRLVSHHLRLLGVLHRATDADVLVLVDCDDSE